MLLWAQPAVASHLISVSVTPSAVNRANGAVTVDVIETTNGALFPFASALINWGSSSAALDPNQAQTVVVGPPNVYKLSVSHTYPDLNTHDVRVSDCCTSGFATILDSAEIDLGCADAPLGGCLAAGASGSQMGLKKGSDPSKNKLKWKWGKGADVMLPQLGDPNSTTPYFFCVYDPNAKLEAVIPASSSTWKAAGTTGFKYTDKAGTNDGVTKIALKSGTGGKAKAQIGGKGATLTLPPLPLVLPVTVQLQNQLDPNGRGTCWEHSFTNPAKKNTMDVFSAKE